MCIYVCVFFICEVYLFVILFNGIGVFFFCMFKLFNSLSVWECLRLLSIFGLIDLIK